MQSCPPGPHPCSSRSYDGWAKVYVFERSYRSVPAVPRAQSRANGARRGVWDDCGGNFRGEFTRREGTSNILELIRRLQTARSSDDYVKTS